MTTRIWIQILCGVVLLVQFLQTPTPYTPPVIPPKPPIDIPDVPPDIPTPPIIPPDVPVEQGKRTVAIIYETEDGTDAFNRQVIRLRDDTREFAQYLKSKGHTLYVLDDDTADEDGELSQFVSALLSVNSTLPRIYIMDASDGRPLHDETITFDITAEQIMDLIKKHGG